MKGKSSRKIKDGKLLRIDVEYDDKIRNVIISGDFFIYPEESVELIEKVFENTEINETNAYFSSIVKDISKKKKIEFIGITADDIADVLKEALI
jgi:lipoate-protein ligase A